ncbi:MAG: DUF4288 domain-containing protein [Pirellulales bacterium]
MLNRYSAKLTFWYDDGQDRSLAVCEERIVTFDARGSKEAMKVAKRSGKQSEYKFGNESGKTIAFRFVGIMDILQLGIECQEGEVWYDVSKKKLSRVKASVLSDDQMLSQLETGNGVRTARIEKE